MEASLSTEPAPATRGAWRLNWLTPTLCRVILAAVLAFDFFGHLYFLHFNCPIDLSGDEAQYWEWSRNLDLSYYSKGPLVAYIIRLSCSIFGDTMPAVRFPAVLLATLTSIVTYLLGRKLFKSERVALGAVLLYHVIPLFVAGSVLMTIDPPFFFCWALATYLLSIVIFDGKQWPWPVIGVVVGIGFLAKYAMFLWFIPMLLALAFDPSNRRWLKSRWPWLAVGVACLFTIQVIVWNARNHWVSLQHVSTQTGTTSGGGFKPANVLEFLGGQIGILGPGAAMLMAATAALALRGRLPHARESKFLAVVGVTFFGITFLDSFRAKIQMNWPAPAYFTLVLLTAYFISTRLADATSWIRWRGVVWFTIGFGLIAMPIAHDPSVLYPAMKWINPRLTSLRHDWLHQSGIRKSIASSLPAKGLSIRTLDFTSKLKGWQEISAKLTEELATLDRDRPGSFVLCHDYQYAACFSFYLPGHPKTYYAASWYQDDPGRMTQYDLWPDRDLSTRSPLVGKNAIYVGHSDLPLPDLLAVFERVEGVTLSPEKVAKSPASGNQRSVQFKLLRGETEVRDFRYFRCYGFKGMNRPPAALVSH